MPSNGIENESDSEANKQTENQGETRTKQPFGCSEPEWKKVQVGLESSRSWSFSARALATGVARSH